MRVRMKTQRIEHKDRDVFVRVQFDD